MAISDSNQPFVIFIEGADGVGKSTVSNLLKEKLSQAGLQVETSGIMQKHPAGAIIRQSNITEEMEHELRFVGYCYGTFYGLKKIFEPNQSKSILIIDRSQASTFAQNICAPDMDTGIKNAMVTIFNKLNDEFKKQFEGRYINVYLHLDPGIALSRISHSRGELDMFEKRGVKFQEKIRAGYDAFYKNNKLHLNFSTFEKEPETIVQEIFNYITKNVEAINVTERST